MSLTQLSLGLCPGGLFALKGHDSLHHCLYQCWGVTIRLDLCHVLLIQRLQSLCAKRGSNRECVDVRRQGILLAESCLIQI